MMLRLQRYDLQVEFADTLSRAPEESTEAAANTKDEFEVVTIENMPVTRRINATSNSQQPFRHRKVQTLSQRSLVLARNEPTDSRHSIQVQCL